jgi:hypothetical protein
LYVIVEVLLITKKLKRTKMKELIDWYFNWIESNWYFCLCWQFQKLLGSTSKLIQVKEESDLDKITALSGVYFFDF